MSTTTARARQRASAWWLCLATGLIAACSGSADSSSAVDSMVEPTGQGDAAASAEAAPVDDERSSEPMPLGAVATGVDSNVLGARVTVTSSQPAVVELVATSGDHAVATPRTAQVDVLHELPLVGLRAGRRYAIEATSYASDGTLLESATTSFETGALPGFVADFDIVTSTGDKQPGLTLVEAVPTGDDIGHAFAIDGDGEVVWYYRYESTVSAVELQADGSFLAIRYPFDFARFDVLGTPIESWVFADETDGSTPLEISWPVGANLVTGVVHSPHHDVSTLPNGNLIGLARVDHEVSAALRQAACPSDDRVWDVTSDVIVEFEPDGTAVRTWNVADAIDINAQPGVHLCDDEGLFATPTERDWSHANAVVYDPEGDVVLVSVRHTDSVIAFERPDTIGHQTDVRWVLGRDGNVVMDGEPFLHQHAPEVQPDGNILLYDNGNERTGEEYSRAVEYELTGDAANGWQAVPVWEHRVDDVDGGPVFAPFLGDADRLADGNTLITHGGLGGPTGTEQRARIIEVATVDGVDEIVYDLRLGTPELGYTVYRADRVASLSVGPLWDA